MTNSKRIMKACGICIDVGDGDVRPLDMPTDCANCNRFDSALAKVMEKLRYGGG